MSSNFIVFPFRAVSGLFFSSLERQREKTRRNGAKGRTEAGGGWQGASGGEVRDKHALSFGTHRRISPSDRPSRGQAAPTRRRAKWVHRRRSLPLIVGGNLWVRLSTQAAHWKQGNSATGIALWV